MRKTILVVLVALVLFRTFDWPSRLEATASSVWTDQVCAGDGTVRVNLHWGPVDGHARDQWLELAWYDIAGQGQQVTSHVYAGPVNNLDWPGLLPASTYYVRVNQRSIEGLVSSSQIFVFKTALCTSTQPGEIVSLPGASGVAGNANATGDGGGGEDNEGNSE